MAKYKIQAPDGKTYTIEGDTEEGAIEFLKGHLGDTGSGGAAPAQQPDQYGGALTDEAGDLGSAARTLSAMSKLSGRSPALDQEAGDARNEQRIQMRQDEYNNMPAWQKPFQAIDDTARTLADGATFGFGDKMAAGIPALFGAGDYESNLEEQRGLTQQAFDRSGGAGTVSSIAGSLVPATQVAKVAAPFIGGAAATAPVASRMASYSALGGIEGAGFGALDAAGHDQDVGKGASSGMLGGMLAGAAAPAVTGALSRAAGAGNDAWRKITGQAPRNAPRLNAEGLGSAKDEAYKYLDNMGVTFDPAAVGQLKQGMNDAATAGRMRPRQNPRANAALEDFNEAVGKGEVRTLSDIDAERQLIDRNVRDVAGQRHEEHFGGIMRNEIDDFLDAAGRGNVRTAKGDPAKGVAKLKEARDLNRRSERMSEVEEAIRTGTNTAGVSRGRSADEAIRGNLKTILNNPKRTKGYSPAEMKALQKAVDGNMLGNASRSVEGILGSRMGIGGITAAAGAAGGLPLGLLAGAGSAALGKAAGKVGDGVTRRQVNALLDTIAAGGKPKGTTKTATQKITEGSIEDLLRLFNLSNTVGAN